MPKREYLADDYTDAPYLLEAVLRSGLVGLVFWFLLAHLWEILEWACVH